MLSILQLWTKCNRRVVCEGIRVQFTCINSQYHSIPMHIHISHKYVQISAHLCNVYLSINNTPKCLKYKEIPVSPSLVFSNMSSIYDVMSWSALEKSIKMLMKKFEIC